eukprot:6067946-Pyramimonas_sp.AAC.1
MSRAERPRKSRTSSTSTDGPRQHATHAQPGLHAETRHRRATWPQGRRRTNGGRRKGKRND